MATSSETVTASRTHEVASCGLSRATWTYAAPVAILSELMKKWRVALAS